LATESVLVIDTITAERVPQLLSLYRSTWWAARRTEADVERMLSASDVIVGLVDVTSDRLVGFARAITDGVYVAVVLDVVVDQAARGTGLGQRIMQEILGRKELADVASVELVCQPELVAFYGRFGFTDRVGRSLLMRRTPDPALADG